MEGAAQIGELRGVGHVVVQSLNGAQGVADDFCRFFQEDVAQVFFFDRGVDDAVVGQRWCGGCGRECRNGLRQCLGVFGLGGLDAVKRLAGLLRQRGLTGQFGLLDHIAELFGGRGGGQGASGLRADQIVQRGDMCLPQLGAGGAGGRRSVACRRGGIIGWRVGRHCYVAVRQLLRFFVEIELCLGQCGLVDHHVEHEGQGAQAIAQLQHGVLVFQRVDGAGLPRSLYQLLHLLRHHGCGFAGIFVIERQQNASDFVELGAGFIGLVRFLRVAEEVVQRLFHFADGGARFGNDLFQAALVVEPCVERFHPFGGRLHLFAALHGFQALRKQGNAFVKLLAVGRGVFCRCFQKENGGCHFHGNVGVWRLHRLSNVRRDAL